MVNIDTLEAGPALDALVAEKVMGLVFIHWDDSKTPGLPDKQRASTPDGERVTVPKYSTDIAAAWEVMKQMRTFWFEGGKHGRHVRDDYEVWGRFTSALWHRFSVWGGDETDAWSHLLKVIEPVDICRAALKAVGA